MSKTTMPRKKGEKELAYEKIRLAKAGAREAKTKSPIMGKVVDVYAVAVAQLAKL